MLSSCLKYFATKNSDKLYQQLHNILQKLDILIGLRNKSIIGHGFEGVSKEIIKKKYKGEVIEDLNRLIEIVFKISDIEVSENPFHKINDILIARINDLN